MEHTYSLIPEMVELYEINNVRFSVETQQRKIYSVLSNFVAEPPERSPSCILLKVTARN